MWNQQAPLNVPFASHGQPYGQPYGQPPIGTGGWGPHQAIGPPPPLIKPKESEESKDYDDDWVEGLATEFRHDWAVAKSEVEPLLGLVSTEKCRARLWDLLQRPDFLTVWLIPTAIYLVTSLLWGYQFLYRPSACILWTAAGVLYCAGLLWLKEVDRHIYTPMGSLGLPAFLVGSLIGLYLYDHCIIYTEFYANSRLYTNVVPGQPAAAVMDAGKVTFSPEAFVDTAQSAGAVDESGTTYCAAPVRDGSGIRRLEFWAVGMGCCGDFGEFTCDAAGDPNAKAGIIVFDNNGYFGESRYEHYERARLKAQAQFSLQSVSSSAYVRWVHHSELDKLAREYRLHGIALWFFYSFACALFFYFGVVALFTPAPAKSHRPPPRPSTAPEDQNDPPQPNAHGAVDRSGGGGALDRGGAGAHG